MKMTSRRSRSRPNQQKTEQAEQKAFFSTTSDTGIQTKEEDAFFQPKLSIGQPGDKYEQEADAMADAVVNGSNDSPAIQQKKAENIQRVSSGTAEERMKEDKMIQEKPEEEEVQMMEEKEEPVQMMGQEDEPVQMMGDQEEEPLQMMEEEEEIQTKSDPAQASQASNQISSKIQQQKGKGKSLPDLTRAEMENSFGADFSDVNIHTDLDAVEMNKELGAQAFATGKDIYFNSGKYRPETSSGKHLLAHELTHVVQQGGGQSKKIQKFEVEDAAGEMVGKTFTLNAEVKVSSLVLPKGSKVVISSWSNSSSTVKANFKSGKVTNSVTIEKKKLTPVGDSSSGLYQYYAGVTQVEQKYSSIEKKIEAQELVIKEWEAVKDKYKSENGKKEWQRQMDVKKTDLADLQYKLTGTGYTSANLPGRLKITNKSGVKKSITPQSVLLNKSLIEQTMLNTFDANIVKWVSYYNKQIGIPKKWPPLDANIVKSMLYQESHMGTHGTFLLKPPYSIGQRMTKFNIGQAIDSSGPQQILMIKEISPAIHTKFSLDQVTKDMWAAKETWAKLDAKGSSRSATEETDFVALNGRSNNGKHWNNYYTSDPRWASAVREFFTETTKARNLDYDYWIRTAVRWLFEKKKSEKNWGDAIKSYNGSGDKAKVYKSDVIKRRDAAKAATGEFTPKQHY